MDINELKKLINEEVSRQRKQKLIKEESEIKKAIYPDDVILTLMLKGESLPLPENSAIHSAVSNIDMKLNLARKRAQIFNKYVPHDAREITIQEVYYSLKNDPQTMATILQFLQEMGATESLLSNFKQRAVSELEQFNVDQPKTNPGTPSAKLPGPEDKTIPPKKPGDIKP
jgi:hypothetical protein